MPATQPIFNAGRLLQDDDCNIQDECNTVGDGVMAIRRKFALVVSEGRQLQREVLAQQAEIEDLKTRLSREQRSTEVARNQVLAQGRRLRQYKESEKTLQRRTRELTRDLEDERAKSEKVSCLKCDICVVNVKDVVTLCGHGYCRVCLVRWLRQPKEDVADDGSRNSCPSCRKPVRESDLLQVYLDSGKQTSPGAEEDRATEILDSDSE